MRSFGERIRSFLRSEDGPTTTEYGIMLALIILVAVGAVNALGTKVSTTFASISTAIPTG